jgi:ADP-ribose pyrophosphatase YjhB (NUDIX family)
MKREHSAGGVVLRERAGSYEIALIRPRGRAVWALPKGHPNPGESLEACAAREVGEETGLSVTLDAPLGSIRYVYQFGGVRVLKSVTFFLFRYAEGTIDGLDPAMRTEVELAAWLPLEEAAKKLAYRGEREVLGRALRKLGLALVPSRLSAGGPAVKTP